jgi:hypothetical protein
MRIPTGIKNHQEIAGQRIGGDIANLSYDSQPALDVPLERFRAIEAMDPISSPPFYCGMDRLDQTFHP